MSHIKTEDFVGNLVGLFQETFEGTGGQGSRYIDGKGHGSFLETLSHISHRQASQSFQEGGATIAGHTAHTLYYLQILSKFMLNEEVKADWASSWSTRKVNESEWQKLKTQLQEQYQVMQQFFQSDIEWNDDHFSEALSILAHSAYHLGAVRVLAVTLP